MCQEAITTNTRVFDYIIIWKKWMSTDDNNRLGLPSSSAGFRMRTGSQDMEEWEESSDRRAARIVDALIEGLPPQEKVAVYHFNLGAVWSSPRWNVESCYQSACLAIEIGLRKNCLL